MKLFSIFLLCSLFTYSAYTQNKTKADIQVTFKSKGRGHCSCPGNGNSRQWDPKSERFITVEPINQHDFLAHAYNEKKWTKSKHKGIVHGSWKTRHLSKKAGKKTNPSKSKPKKQEGSYGI